MSGHLRPELEKGMVTIIDEPYLCFHGLGDVVDGYDDFRTIVDCLSLDV